MWALTDLISGIWRSIFGNSPTGGGMKSIGLIILVAGLALGVYALTMEVSVHVPAQDLGYGLRMPAADIANVDRMAQRQNLIIFSGVLAVVGAILIGFASMRPAPIAAAPAPSPARPAPLSVADIGVAPSSVSICPKCRSMSPGDATECARCGAVLS